VIYRLRHVTEYHYARPVDLAAHLLHLRPRPLPHQRILGSRITATPEPSHRSEGPDHFGNIATRLFLDAPHARIRVVAEATVDVAFPAPPELTPAWEAVAAAARRDPGAAEFTTPSRLAPRNAAATAYARDSFPAGRPVLDGLVELTGRIRREFAYRPGTTGNATQVAEVMEKRRGVCQDFSHAMIAGLRGLGLPARYVSGYLRTKPPPGTVALRGADQSHAWVGAWLGPGLGWVDLDPTNDLVVAEEHVVLAWGRDFGDVSPLSGVILGGGAHRLTVGVEMEPG
jgi:transglutaminase-like putative cysteine protease